MALFDGDNLQLAPSLQSSRVEHQASGGIGGSVGWEDKDAVDQGDVEMKYIEMNPIGGERVNLFMPYPRRERTLGCSSISEK